MSPVPSTGIVGSNLVYNPRSPVESGSAGQMHLLSNSSPSLPERPDQPECRYFMSTGNCKYGTDCKYHHPKERNAQSASNPLGLPSRPVSFFYDVYSVIVMHLCNFLMDELSSCLYIYMQGQALCSYYSMYGICKYGPTCKFDHPPLSYPYNFPAMLDSPFLSHQRSFATVPTTETPHSIPAKSFDVVQKPLKNKSWNSETRLSEDSSKQVGSLVHTPPSSEASEDQSG